jgi:DNA-binding transcriptional ArsR family regulator
MPSAEAAKMSAGLKALCDPNRIRILAILVSGEHCVSELVDRLGVDQPKVSHHLGILRAASIIRSRRDGRHINYSVRPGVHRRQVLPDGVTDVIDLGHLSVSFRFGREPELHTGLERVPAEPAASAQAAE